MNATDQFAAIAASPSWLGRLARRLRLHRLKLGLQLSLVAMLLSMAAIT